MANAPIYQNPSGEDTDALGVVLIDPATGNPQGPLGEGDTVILGEGEAVIGKVEPVKPDGTSYDPDAPAAVTPQPTTTLTTGQASLAAVGLIVAASATRRSLRIRNSHATVSLFIGATAGVLTTTGDCIPALQEIDLDGYVGAVYGIPASGTVVATYRQLAD